MGRRGPAPAPIAIKLAKGESRPSRVNYDAPQLRPPDSVAPPRGLDGAGLTEWNRHAPQLVESGVLTGPDLGAFEDYCRALSELRRFEARAKRVGTELAITKGIQGAVIKLRQQVNQLRQQCGLTPSSRSAVRAASPRKPSSSLAADKYLALIDSWRKAPRPT